MTAEVLGHHRISPKCPRTRRQHWLGLQGAGETRRCRAGFPPPAPWVQFSEAGRSGPAPGCVSEQERQAPPPAGRTWAAGEDQGQTGFWKVVRAVSEPWTMDWEGFCGPFPLQVPSLLLSPHPHLPSLPACRWLHPCTPTGGETPPEPPSRVVGFSPGEGPFSANPRTLLFLKARRRGTSVGPGGASVSSHTWEDPVSFPPNPEASALGVHHSIYAASVSTALLATIS